MAATAQRDKAKVRVRPVVFESEMSELAVLIKSGQTIVDGWGNRSEVRPVFAQFSANRFVITEDSAEAFDMTRDELVKRMREHGSNRDSKNSIGRDFWELHPSEYAPESDQAIKDVTHLAAAGDRQGLAQLLEEERTGWERPDVLELAAESLALLEQRK